MRRVIVVLVVALAALALIALLVVGVIFVGASFLGGPGKPERVQLGSFPCAEHGLVVEETHVTVNRLEGVVRYALAARRAGESVALELGPLPAHLRARTDGRFSGDGPLWVHVFQPSDALAACFEANAAAISPVLRASETARSHAADASVLGRAYWSVPASSLEQEFRDGPRTLAIHRDGHVRVTEGAYTTLFGIVREDRFECCYGNAKQEDLARFTDAAGRSAAEALAPFPVAPLRL